MNKKETEQFLKSARPYECKSLYKYRSFSSMGLAEIFSKHEIYLSSPNKFNDPFDCRPNIIIHQNKDKFLKWARNIVREREPNLKKYEINRFIKNNERLKLLKSKKFQKEFFRAFISDIGIYSLSEICDDILMWSHYSDSHTGICIEFQADIEYSIFWESFKVGYQEEYPTVNIMEIGQINQWMKALTVKSSHWSYEIERRVIKSHEDGGPGIYKFRPELIKSVILGACVSKEHEYKVIEWVSNHPTPIQIKKALLNENSFKIDII